MSKVLSDDPLSTAIISVTKSISLNFFKTSPIVSCSLNAQIITDTVFIYHNAQIL